MMKSDPRMETTDEVRVATSMPRICPPVSATIATRRQRQFEADEREEQGFEEERVRVVRDLVRCGSHITWTTEKVVATVEQSR